MPIYAPSLPPRTDLDQGDRPIVVLARFDLRRILRLKLGRFFGFAFLLVLIIQLAVLYVRYILNANPALGELARAGKTFLAEDSVFHAGLLTASGWTTTLLWFQVALIGGGLIARDTLYRVRPLMYAHPLRPTDYLMAKAMIAVGLPLFILLPFAILPWGLSVAVAGAKGPVWIHAPLLLVPAAFLMSLLMGAVALGASALAATPRAGLGWVLGLVFGTGALGGILTGVFNDRAWMALSPAALVEAWPRLLCGSTLSGPPLWAVAVGTLVHVLLWTGIAFRRVRPTEGLS